MYANLRSICMLLPAPLNPSVMCQDEVLAQEEMTRMENMSKHKKNDSE